MDDKHELVEEGWKWCRFLSVDYMNAGTLGGFGFYRRTSTGGVRRRLGNGFGIFRPTESRHVNAIGHD